MFSPTTSIREINVFSLIPAEGHPSHDIFARNLRDGSLWVTPLPRHSHGIYEIDVFSLIPAEGRPFYDIFARTSWDRCLWGTPVPRHLRANFVQNMQSYFSFVNCQGVQIVVSHNESFIGKHMSKFNRTVGHNTWLRTWLCFCSCHGAE